MKNFKNKTKKKDLLKAKKYRSEEQEEIIKFIRILLIVLIFVLIFYFATRIFVKKDLLNKEEETSVTEIVYDKIIFGMLFNRPYDEYYALAYASDDNNASYYNSLISSYTSNTDHSYLYYIDLNDSLNENYISKDGITNKNAKGLDELKVGSLTLVKVKGGKIVKYLENVEDIKAELK